MIFVALNNIQLNGQHGAYPEEKVLGNTFLLNVKVGCKNEEAFIDYALILQCVQAVFNERENYLETLILKMETTIKKEMMEIDYIYISIKKQHPPLGARVQSSEVILEKNY
jgi:7,8-dihydroneopterin aldolase/epimerase/oxygenase